MSISFNTFLSEIGLKEYTTKIANYSLESIVQEAGTNDSLKLSTAEVEKLYTYQTPKLSPDGSCSVGDGLEEKPYDLRNIFGDNYTKEFQHIDKIVQLLYSQTKLDWLGVYKKTKNLNNEDVLVKLAYRGAPSRAEFPLTTEFAKSSNNSTVGLTAKSILVQDVAQYEGPYYECDNKVLSEFCCPILDDNNELIGIIDAESFDKQFFTEEKILQITKVCWDLRNILSNIK